MKLIPTDSNIPRLGGVSSAVGLLREGFPFIMNRCRELNSDMFEIDVPFLDVICISGPEAAKIFYDTEKFIRHGAIPKRVQKTLTGENSLHTLDNGAHKHRKEMFMTLASPESLQKLMDLVSAQWQTYMANWEKMDQVVLFDEAQEIMCRAACEWAGIPLPENEVRERAQEFIARIDAFGAFGPRHWRGRMARLKNEQWIMGIIEDVRSGKITVPEGTPLHMMAWRPDYTGKPMDTHMAAVELINSVRPTVAIAYYVTFAALALHEHPQYRQQLRAGDDADVERFVQEVRRYYPFAPFLGARVREPFEWRGYSFAKGAMVLLDVYGINHDARHWERPGEFWPERFRHWNGSPFNFIPQGGGDPNRGHRCPGERITIDAMKIAVKFLATELTYDVLPGQDLDFSLSRMPTYPRSGFVISNVKRAEKAVPAAHAG